MIIQLPEQLAQSISEDLAKVITADLFSNSNGDVAKRLVLELADEQDGGGWSQDAATARVIYVIQQWLAQA